MTEPFHTVLAGLLDERGMSPHALATQLQERHDWGSSTGTSKMVRGELVPGVEGFRFIAEVLEVDPDVFAEYRLAVARDALDWREVGLDQALANLENRPVGKARSSAVKRAEKVLEQALADLRGG